ncbi:MAG: serine hydrolase [Fidelibacterota bacterium]|nr:MAG: serine hydrolase [Candidatus Neomarinimicrobiota bacterium]
MRIIRKPSALLQLFLLLIAGFSITRAQEDPLKGLDTYIEQAMQAWELPGLAIAVVKDDQVVYARGFGVRELGRPDQVNEHTLFAVASHTKAFTGLALGLLVQQGQLSWDDRVVYLMPGFQLYDPVATREMTVRDLLTHKQGYRTWAGDLLWWASNLSRQDVLVRLKYLEPDYSFRSRYGYNNMMFVAAGELIPIITDTTWDDYVTARLLKPLGMSRTNTSISQLPENGNVASPHIRIDGKMTPIPYRNIDNSGPAGALNSSASDMARWLRFQLAFGHWEGIQLVDSAIIRETRTPQTLLRPGANFQRHFTTTHFLAYGLGWFMQDYHGYLVLRHSGGMDGMLSYSLFLPEAGVGVTLLTNAQDQRLYSSLPWYVVDRLLSLPAKDWSIAYLADAKAAERKDTQARKIREKNRAKRSKPTLPLKAYAGTFHNDFIGTATVTHGLGRLVLHLNSHENVIGPLEHWHYDTFVSKWSDPMWGESFVTFTLDSNGKATALSLKVREEFIDPLEYSFQRAR